MHGWEEQHDPEKKIPIRKLNMDDPKEVERINKALKDFAEEYQKALDKEKRGGLLPHHNPNYCPHCIVLTGRSVWCAR